MAKAKNILEPAEPIAPVEPIAPESPPDAPPAAPLVAKLRAKVHVPTSHVGTIDAEIPGDTPLADRTRVAIQAAKDARGIVHFGSAPEVEFLE